MPDRPSGLRALDKRCVLLLALAAAIFPRTSRAEESGAPARLTLVWMDPDELLRFGFQAMADEVTEAFEQAGVAVTWRKNTVATDDDPLELVVNLRRAPPADWRLGDHAMGATFKEKHRRRVVFIFFTSVLTTLGIRYEVPRIPTATETMLLAQALARVVSHEVIHAIVPEAPHAKDGLMQSQLTRASLRASQLRLSESGVRSLRAALEEMGDSSRDCRH